ncbi:hypothetical protein [Winogradskyella sp.]|uniref:hypothetical protein n=1 Tax=Winogradskyella sp. TaxID=1883156 RepID=UPI001B209A2A|nr:hypothetical protein [Winogradskyella sp.]MBO6881130.1 hypothetical protein [Winogradskyella sp.]
MKSKSIQVYAIILCLSLFASCDQSEKLDQISESVDNIENSLTRITEARQEIIKDLIMSDGEEKFPEIYLNADFSKEIKQHIHIDLVKQFGIIAHSKIKSDGTYEMKVILREINGENDDQRNTYDLTGARYKEELLKDGKTLHHIYLDIIESESDEDETYVIVENITNFKPKKGEIIDIHAGEKFKNLNFWTDYGQQFCKSIVTGP